MQNTTENQLPDLLDAMGDWTKVEPQTSNCRKANGLFCCPRCNWVDEQDDDVCPECHWQPGTCEKCGKVRKELFDGLCGTCAHRMARKINTREMYGHGRRGY